MSVMIRQAQEADLPAILTLYAQPEIDDGDVLPVAEAAKVFRRFADYPDYRLFVAEEEGVVVGSYALLIMDNLGHLGAPSALVEDVVVDPNRHGSGIGKTMMRAALAEARRKGCYKMALSANQKRDRAHAFYESLGFERHGYSFLVKLEETV
jgi:ribosomal protein S18 acetylase RimI-like enzyme